MMLEVDNLSVRFGATRVFNNLNFGLERGESLAIRQAPASWSARWTAGRGLHHSSMVRSVAFSLDSSCLVSVP